MMANVQCLRQCLDNGANININKKIKQIMSRNLKN